MLPASFIEQSPPKSLQAWAALAIFASFPAEVVATTYIAALEYIGWLESLPVTER